MEAVVDILKDVFKNAFWPLGAADLNFMAMMFCAFHGFLILGIYRSVILNNLSQFLIFTFMLVVSSCIVVFFMPLVYYMTAVLAVAIGIYTWRNIDSVLLEELPSTIK